MNYLLRAACVLVAAVASASNLSAADWTWTYAVQATATVETSPPRITVRWPTDELPSLGYTIWRKGVDEKTWGAAIPLAASATSYVDTNVAVGGVYEYQIEKDTGLYSAWGYLCVGLNASPIESRGRLVLVVDNSVAGALGTELRRLQQDLIGDGWAVVRRDVGRGDSPASVRNTIRAEWDADRVNTRAVFLFGRVPIPRSGNLNIDGHGARPMPADVYYGDMDGTWTDANGDGVLDQNTVPTDVELEVGRVDFADLPAAYAAQALPSETDLLRRYLEKDHAFRHAITRPTARALMGNVVGDGRGQAAAASGFRAFAALVGPSNVENAGTDLTTPVADRFITKLATRDYLWAYACGAGGDYSLGILGTHGEFNDIWGSDFVQSGAKGTFYMFFGSWLGEWAKQDNMMRSALAAPDYGLTAVWSGRPHFYFHQMGVGRTIGASVRTSQNNSGLFYRNQVQRIVRGVHMALMGDPTLRLNVVAPPSNLRAAINGGDVTLTWSASTDNVLGYRVYRSASLGAAWERISETQSATSFVDRPPNPNDATYMVRAITLQSGPSGTYYNLSQGSLSRDEVSIAASAAPPTFDSTAKITGNAIEVGTDIVHVNGNTYDQVILNGPAATVSADPGQIMRLSFIDLNDDIVQVELSGPGALSILLEGVSGPAAPQKYNQGVAYMKGRASISITGANETTNLTVFSVGRATAVNQSLFRSDVTYDGVADIALIMISTLNGRFGGLRTANVTYSSTKGTTGLYGSEAVFSGPVLIGDIHAIDSASALLSIGGVPVGATPPDIRITGGDLYQPNGRIIQISGFSTLRFTDGTTSHGNTLPAQANRGRFERNGVDVTAQILTPVGNGP